MSPERSQWAASLRFFAALRMPSPVRKALPGSPVSALTRQVPPRPRRHRAAPPQSAYRRLGFGPGSRSYRPHSRKTGLRMALY